MAAARWSPPDHADDRLVLLQAFTANFIRADAQSLPEYDADPPWPYSQGLTRIWPAKQPAVHWPPTHHPMGQSVHRVAIHHPGLHLMIFKRRWAR